MRFRLRDLVPDGAPLSGRERVRCAAGAAIGILATGLVSRAAIGSEASLPALIAPMGASAVLLFAVPTSPLAQPWSILGGNVVAAAVGVTAAAIAPNPVMGAPLAIAAAIGLMMALRCLHPPSGAVALTAVLGGPDIRDLGYAFALWPVGANSLLLLATALLFNNLTGRVYPQTLARMAADNGADGAAPSRRKAFAASDLDAALNDFDGVLDMGRADLAAILLQAQRLSRRRAAGQGTCADIMSRDVIAIAPCAPLRDAFDLLRGHPIKALPVTDEQARIVGLVTQTDLLDKTVWERPGPRLGLSRRLRLTLLRGRAPHGAVQDVMTTPVRVVRPDTPIADLVIWMPESGLQHLPVVGADGRLVGIVSQTDLLGELLAEAAERGGRASREPPP